MPAYEVVEYIPSRKVPFDNLESAERYLEGIQNVDLYNLYFIERNGEAIK